jgi:hypothetical protein
VVAGKSDYPADSKQINDLIIKLLDIKTAELHTNKVENHEELEVTEEKAKNLIKFFREDGSLLTGVVVGKSQEAGGGAFVRKIPGEAVYLTKSAPWFRTRALDYVNQEIASVKREDVNAVTVTTPEGTYTLRAKPEGEGVVMENLPAGKKLKDADAKSVFEVLTSLRFEDVNQPADVEGLNFDCTYVCRLDDSTEYRLLVAKKGDKTYLKAEAEYTDKTPVQKKLNEVESEEQLKEKEAKLLADENAKKFTLRHKGWVYQIADWKAKYLTKSASDLLEDVEKEEPAAVQEPAPQEAPSPAVEPAVDPNAVPVGPAADPNAAVPGR